MKIVIDIDDKIYNDAKNGYVRLGEIADAVLSGTPYEERPQGEWKCTFHSSFPQYEPDEYTCSICNGKSGKLDKFCKHCGADMRGGRE